MQTPFSLLLFVCCVVGVLSEGYGPEQVVQHSGYIDVDNDHGAHIFYWFFEARNNPKEAPLMVWLTGGPGCSSLLALFTENGPYFPPSEDLELTLNPYSWNEVANVIWVEQPVGTGFSWAEHISDYVYNEHQMAVDMYEFLQGFLSLYPEYQSLDFFISGESYAGHYIPAWASYIIQQNKAQISGTVPVNLKGVAIGDGWVDPLIQYKTYAQYMYMNNMIDLNLVKWYNNTEYPKCAKGIETNGSTAACSIASQRILSEASRTVGYDMNQYNIRIPCCYNFTNTENLLNQPAIKEAIGAKTSITWKSCSTVPAIALGNDEVQSYAPNVKVVLEAGVKVLIYAGTDDYICNYMGCEDWMLELEWSGQQDFIKAENIPWYLPGTTTQAGWIKTYDPLSFLGVFNSGHLVPMDQPVASLDMISRFMNYASR